MLYKGSWGSINYQSILNFSSSSGAVIGLIMARVEYLLNCLRLTMSMSAGAMWFQWWWWWGDITLINYSLEITSGSVRVILLLLLLLLVHILLMSTRSWSRMYDGVVIRVEGDRSRKPDGVGRWNREKVNFNCGNGVEGRIQCWLVWKTGWTEGV